jgi:NAD(P)-dependent dehydrogenase (short-subunit alcohol dehydrogenase family)
MTRKAANTPLTAIVTGGSTGIGYAVAQRLLEDGYNIVLGARTSSDLEAARDALSAYGRVESVAGDVADPETGRRLVARAVEAYGGLDVLVNNAGVFNPKPFLETEESEIDRILRDQFQRRLFHRPGRRAGAEETRRRRRH